jgi:hypothetical protein
VILVVVIVSRRLASRILDYGLAECISSGERSPGTSRARRALPELPDVPTGCELTSNPRALALIALAETPFLKALPLVTAPDIPADRLRFHGDDRDGAFVE